MTQSVLIALVAMMVAGALLRLNSWSRRWRYLRTVDPSQILRQNRGVSMRVLVQGTRVLAGMSTRKANRTVGDLVLSRDRFLITSGRGLIADLRDGGRRFRSVRCTGPGRLVIEGDVPGPDPERPGLYRVELMLQDASEWATALAPWVREGGEFTSM